MNGEEPPKEAHDKPVESNEVVMENQPQGTNAPIVQQSIREETPSIPFPKRLRKENEEAQQRNFLENLKQLHLNISFIEALIQMPKCAKYLKSLLTNKSKLEEACMVTINERCLAILLNELTSKEKDLTSIRRINPVNTPYSKKKPELEKISEEEKSSLFQVLEKLKEAEDLVTDHLSKFQNSHMEELTEREIADKFSDKHLMLLKSKYKDDEPCETLEILAHCHLGPTGGHHSANGATKKVYEAGFYWPSAFKDANDESRLMQLNELAELRDGANENTRIYKEWTKKWHDSRLRGDRNFKVGDKVLLYNSYLKMYPGKIKSKWSGPNIVKTVYPHGAIEITNKDEFSFKVNGQRLKKYYGGDIDKEDDEVIELENDAKRS
ncbi:hypothetical protein Tco_1501306 [Tanacetum coccineum]